MNPIFYQQKYVNQSAPSFRVGSLSHGVLGGTRNTMQVFPSNAVAFASINPNNEVEVYAPDSGILGDEYIADRAISRLKREREFRFLKFPPLTPLY